MSRLAEIEQVRARIARELRRKEDARRQQLKVITQLPDGFYNPKQTERFLKVDALFTETLRNFMRELGVGSYNLQKATDWREFYYLLGFTERRSAEKDYVENNKQTAQILYLPKPASLISSAEGLRLRYSITILTPPGRCPSSVSPQEVLKLSRLPEASEVHYPYIGLHDITKEGIEDLLTLIVSDPNIDIEFLDPKDLT